MENNTDIITTITKRLIESELREMESPLIDKEKGLSEDIYDSLCDEIYSKIPRLLDDCYSNVEHEFEIEKRNKNAHKSALYYKVYWKNDHWPKTKKGYEVLGIYNNLIDAEDTVWSHHVWAVFTHYKIFEFRNGVKNKKFKELLF